MPGRAAHEHSPYPNQRNAPRPIPRTISACNTDTDMAALLHSEFQTQLDALATSLNQPGALGFGTQSLLPFQVAFYGMCLLVILQSAFSLAAGIVLLNLRRATTIYVPERDPVRAS